MTELTKRIFSSFFLILAIGISFSNSIMLFIFLFLINFFALNEFINIFKKIIKDNILLFFITIIILSYLTYFSFLVWIFLTPLSDENIISLIFILSICALTDIGGYIVGKIIGGKKFNKISPNKTYSGVVGSFILPLMICYFIYGELNNYFNFNVNVIILIVSISFISQLGDLVISFFKRKAKIKDTGSILPGHGGILDRIDGILLGLPLGIILISI